tara:strand:+ start:1222 stop:1671 length:450 start_codon:yes stop_codon:yes gene_type:complete
MKHLSKRFINSLIGQNYSIECPKCDYVFSEITIGVGYLFGNIDDLLHGLKGEDKKIVQSLHNMKSIHHYYSRGFSLYQCSNCFSLENKCHLDLYNSQGDLLFATQSFCDLCQQNRDYLPEDFENETVPGFYCPKCHHHELSLLIRATRQ